MGWAGGSDVMEQIAKSANRYVKDKKVRAQVYEDVIIALNDHDWDTHHDVHGIDPVLDEVMDNLGYGPSCDDDEESEAVDLNERIIDLFEENTELKKQLETQAKEHKKVVAKLKGELNARKPRAADLEMIEWLRTKIDEMHAELDAGRRELGILRTWLGRDWSVPLDEDLLAEITNETTIVHQWLGAFGQRLGI